MDTILLGFVSAAEFGRARGAIPGLADHLSYDDWLDSRYGRLMGLSISGANAELKPVALDDFLDWSGVRNICPSEAALDDFAQGQPPRSEPKRARWASLLGRRGNSRSVGSDP